MVAVRPDVSVLIPTHNRWGFLSSFGLPSALCQQDIEVEVVVIDDGSTDATAAQLDALADPRIRIVRNETRQGLPHARNRGIAVAGGRWLAFLDDDDCWSPRKLRMQVDAALAAGADFAYSSALVIDSRWKVVAATAAPDPSTLLDALLRRNVIQAGGSNVVARTAVVRMLGGFDENLHHLADWDMWIRLARGGHAAAVAETLVAYHLHPGNLHLTNSETAVEFAIIMEKHDVPEAARRATRITAAQWRAFSHRRAGDRFGAAREYVRAGVTERDLGMFARALGVPFGERIMTLGRRGGAIPRTIPSWLTRYADDGSSSPLP